MTNPAPSPDTPAPAAPDEGAVRLRLTLLGLATTQDLEALFGVCDDTVTRAYKRGDLPPPVTLFGRNVWSVDAIKNHLAQRLEAARIAAERAQAQQDAKVQALYGGSRHGQRP